MHSYYLPIKERIIHCFFGSLSFRQMMSTPSNCTMYKYREIMNGQEMISTNIHRIKQGREARVFIQLDMFKWLGLFLLLVMSLKCDWKDK